MSAASIALEVAEVEGQLVSAQTIRHTLQQVGLHGRHPRRKPFLKLAHKKVCKQFAEDNLAKSMNYWNHVLWSDESKAVGISLRLQGKLGFPYNVKQLMVKYVLLC